MLTYSWSAIVTVTFHYAKHKIGSMSSMLYLGEIQSDFVEFLTHKVSKQTTLANFEKKVSLIYFEFANFVARNVKA